MGRTQYVAMFAGKLEPIQGKQVDKRIYPMMIDAHQHHAKLVLFLHLRSEVQQGNGTCSHDAHGPVHKHKTHRRQ